MKKVTKAAKPKAAQVKDLTVRDAKAVKGGAKALRIK